MSILPYAAKFDATLNLTAERIISTFVFFTWLFGHIQSGTQLVERTMLRVNLKRVLGGRSATKKTKPQGAGKPD